MKSRLLRLYAGYLSYYNKSLATWDAMRIGRLHTLTSHWRKASLSFLRSGGFKIRSIIPKVQQPVHIIWGKQDNIISLETLNQFQKDLPRLTYTIIDKCGHVPHIEKPKHTLHSIFKFLKK